MKLPFMVMASVASLGWFNAAQAQSAGSNVVGVGLFRIAPQDSSKPLEVTAPAAAARQIPNTGADVDARTTLGLTFERYLTDNLGAEIVLGIPPRFHLSGEKALAPVGELGSAKQWSPAVLLKYHFGEAQSAFRPFVGAGVSYFWYTDTQLTDNFQRTLSSSFTGGAFSGARTDATIDRKWAPVLNVGASYKLNQQWGIVGSLSYIPLKTKAKLSTYLPGGTVVQSEAGLKLNPIVAKLELTYQF